MNSLFCQARGLHVSRTDPSGARQATCAREAISAHARCVPCDSAARFAKSDSHGSEIRNSLFTASRQGAALPAARHNREAWMKRKRIRLLAAMAGVLMACAAPAIAQDYPSRPIEVIVGFPPGSAVDTNIRAILPTLQKILNVPIVVDNRPGAGGAIGFNSVAKVSPMATRSGASISRDRRHLCHRWHGFRPAREIHVPRQHDLRGECRLGCQRQPLQDLKRDGGLSQGAAGSPTVRLGSPA